MGRSHTLEAIVLQTHNVGEADRFCILFTRERGKLAARARGVRKLQSKMGGTLLPMQHIHVDIVEGSAGMLITSVHRIGKETNADLKSFSQTQQGIEMLISILEDDHPLEEIFDLTLKFLEACDNGHDKPLLPFSIRLLHLLGVLPDRKSDIFRVLSDEELIYIERCIQETNDLPVPDVQSDQLSRMCMTLMKEEANRTLKAPDVISALI